MTNDPYQIGEDQGWYFEKIQNIKILQQKVTLTGSSYIVSYKVDFPFKLQRLNFAFRNENAKALQVKVFDYKDSLDYEYIRRINLNTKEHFLFEFDDIYTYISGTTIQIEFLSYVANDICNIQLVIKDLREGKGNVT